MTVVVESIYDFSKVALTAALPKLTADYTPIAQVPVSVYFPMGKTAKNISSISSKFTYFVLGPQRYSISRVRYDMSGFDSSWGTRVYWSSMGMPNLTPTLTNPVLVGTLQDPHIIGVTTY
jgi:hypothetical protein